MFVSTLLSLLCMVLCKEYLDFCPSTFSMWSSCVSIPTTLSKIIISTRWSSSRRTVVIPRLDGWVWEVGSSSSQLFVCLNCNNRFKAQPNCRPGKMICILIYVPYLILEYEKYVNDEIQLRIKRKYNIMLLYAILKHL